MTLLLKKLLFKLIHLYTYPLVINKKVYSYVRQKYFSHVWNHFFTTADIIKTAHKDLDPSCIFIDVGSANGDTLLYLNKEFPDFPIYGFEPNEKVFMESVKKCKAYKNILIKNIALSESKGEGTLFITQNLWSSSLMNVNSSNYNDVKEQGIEVVDQQITRLQTLDEEFVNVNKVALLKIDTQGSELSILKGGTSVLKKTKYVLIEMNNSLLYENGCQYYDIDDFLRKNSFKLHTLFSSTYGISEYDALYINTTFNL